MGIMYGVKLGQEPVFVPADLSPNPAVLSAKHSVSWVVDDAIYTDDGEMIMDFEQIVNSGLVSFSVRADDLDAVYSLTAVHAAGEPLDVNIMAFRSGLQLAALKLDSSKIVNVYPLWGAGHKSLFHVANLSAGSVRHMWDRRPPHTSVRGE
jgi:hypothetical protein